MDRFKPTNQLLLPGGGYLEFRVLKTLGINTRPCCDGFGSTGKFTEDTGFAGHTSTRRSVLFSVTPSRQRATLYKSVP